MAKISKNLVLLISIIAGVIYFSSCEKYTFRVESLPPVDTTNYVKFSTEIQPIFTANCISCHEGTRNPDLREGNSYASLTSGGYVTSPAADSKLYKQLISGSHSSSSWATQTQKNTIFLWISQGAKNNKK